MQICLSSMCDDDDQRADFFARFMQQFFFYFARNYDLTEARSKN